jgi:hypothetical protein
MNNEVIAKEKEIYPAWGGIVFSRAFASRFPITMQILNAAVNDARLQAKKRAFESATGIAWEDRYKTHPIAPGVTVKDVRVEIERQANEIRGERDTEDP